MKRRKTIGLALGSGAYRGFAHIGVIRSLEKHNIPVDFLSGTSIGAWVAAYYAIYQDLALLEKDLAGNIKENLPLLFDFSRSGVIGGQKFSNYLEQKLQRYSFANLRIPLQIAATDLANGQAYVFKSGDVARAVRASTSVPLVFKPLTDEGRVLVDGGMSNPVPCNLVKEMGADIVIGVNLYNTNEFSKSRPSITDIPWRSSVIMLYNLSQASMSVADIIIEPDLSAFRQASGLSKYFDQGTARKMMEAGERAANAAIPAIRKLLAA